MRVESIVKNLRLMPITSIVGLLILYTVAIRQNIQGGITFAVEIENDHSQETFAVSASFNNESLWLVNCSS